MMFCVPLLQLVEMTVQAVLFLSLKQDPCIETGEGWYSYLTLFVKAVVAEMRSFSPPFALLPFVLVSLQIVESSGSGVMLTTSSPFLFQEVKQFFFRNFLFLCVSFHPRNASIELVWGDSASAVVKLIPELPQ
jgi:hypothetical protein